MSVVNTIRDAMAKRKKITISYADLGQANPKGPYAGLQLFRDLVPLTVGTTKKGNLALRAFDDYRGEYRLFLISHINNLTLTGVDFNENGYPAYNGSDKMLSIQFTLSRIPKQDSTNTVRTRNRSKIGKAIRFSAGLRS